MAENSPAESLLAEHKVIQEVVAAMSVVADDLRAGSPAEPADLQDIVNFLRVYADELHHGKEEEYLFPLLEARGVPPTGCPIGALKNEHAKGRALVAQLAEAVDSYTSGEAPAPDPVIAALTALVDLYPNHIWKEDYLLLPLSGKVLSEADLKDLEEKFKGVDEAIGLATRQKHEELASRLRPK